MPDPAARYREETGREPPEPLDEETERQFSYRGHRAELAEFLSGRDPGDEDATGSEQPGLFA